MRTLTPLLGMLLLATGPAVAQDLFLTNAHIVDPATREVTAGNLLIVDGTIAGRPTQAPDGFAGRTIDLNDRWVIPGLTDLHTHSYGNQAPGGVFESAGSAVVASRMLYAGVFGFVDLFGAEESLYALREAQRRGEVGGATLFASLSCLTATRGHCTEYGVQTRTMDSPEEARSVVNDLATRDPDVVKIVYSPTGGMPSIDRPTLAAAIETASANGIKTVIHVNTWDDVRDAVESGASAVTHVPEGPIPADLAPLMVSRGVVSIPTLAVQTDFADFFADSTVLTAELARALAPASILAAYDPVLAAERTRLHAQGSAASTEGVLASVRAMAEVGVTILTGTDAGNFGTIQGYSVHRELIKLVAAGLSPWDALAASTTRAGEFLGRSWGVSVGDVANLVVLDASPIDDIANTQRIVMVIQRGMVIDRDASRSELSTGN